MQNKDIVQMFMMMENLDSFNKKKYKLKIFENTLPTVYKICKKYKKYKNYEDLIQDGLFYLTRAIDTFEYTQYYNFNKYIFKYLGFKIARLYRRQHRKLKLNKDCLVDDGPEEFFIKIENRICLEKVLNNFSQRERDIVLKSFGVNSDKFL